MRQAPAISPAAARPIIPAIPVATDSDTRPGDGNAPYPRIPPTARPTRYHLLSPTARQGGHTPQYRPPYRLWRPPRLSTLPPTATTGRGMATPLSAHFPICRADQIPSALPHSAAKGLYAAVSPAISPAAVRLAISTAANGDARLGDGDAPYPRIPPATPGAVHILQTKRGCPPAVHRAGRSRSAGKKVYRPARWGCEAGCRQ